MSEPLKPCPFCSSIHITNRHVRDGRQMFCQNCGASVAPTYHGPNNDTLARAIEAWNRRSPSPSEPFQSRVAPWMQACFGPEISADKLERGDRLLEEVFELLQSGDYPRERVRDLEEYVWSRSIGDPAQEVGGVMVTLAAYCLAHDIDMHAAGETELTRIWGKVEQIRAKQATKPNGSALPIAVSPSPSVDR